MSFFKTAIDAITAGRSKGFW